MHKIPQLNPLSQTNTYTNIETYLNAHTIIHIPNSQAFDLQKESYQTIPTHQQALTQPHTQTLPHTNKHTNAPMFIFLGNFQNIKSICIETFRQNKLHVRPGITQIYTHIHHTHTLPPLHLCTQVQSYLRSTF